MECLRDKLTQVITEDIPDTMENEQFCGSEGEYEEQGFHEMMNRIMETITDHITQED